MTYITDLQHGLDDTQATVAQLERALVEHGASPSLAAMIRSLEKRSQTLQAEFARASHALGIDVCHYRLFGESAHPPVLALAKSLETFQTLFSVVYEALETATPKLRARIGPDVQAKTTFQFGYSYPGSLGIALTIENERRLLGDSTVDAAIQTIFDMAKATTSEEIASHVEQVGVASVRHMYQWAFENARSGLGVEIEWRRENETRTSLLTQQPEFERLYQTIDLASEEQTEDVTLEGMLEGADVRTRTFRLRLTDGSEVRGKLQDAIGINSTVELPKPYRVSVRRTSKTLYSTEQEAVTYQLLSLTPL
ncbi:MAG: hypothetical protein JW395_0694 [Nitrospira sp.]|nr:hypothetical protein [Nitrospira sp.]